MACRHSSIFNSDIMLNHASRYIHALSIHTLQDMHIHLGGATCTRRKTNDFASHRPPSRKLFHHYGIGELHLSLFGTRPTTAQRHRHL
ncbi:hypothetical protein FIBSPDRAFT_344739 [Athelia psychrophila]|uniref:Uncharacterized protein n=1 Tax=Athelia psychrophila TaxID=1759441 RepID=A0A167W3A0_9AGAM|nr:hypothetical protein FIBSPDRAFT_344739 [Fibularhizoctonia sp. CBS 109695]